VKPFEVPVLHVNSSDIDAVIKACRFAVAYWSKYGKDVLLDMVGYRYYGHNEVDEPTFTQPIMYGKIRSMDTPPTAYESKLIADGTISKEDAQKLRQQIE
jgi:2-oxoglutarate dehydrogenase E1 component